MRVEFLVDALAPFRTLFFFPAKIEQSTSSIFVGIGAPVDEPMAEKEKEEEKGKEAPKVEEAPKDSDEKTQE